MEKHKAVVTGEVHLKRYRFGSNYSYIFNIGIYEDSEYKESNVLWSGELDNPPVEAGEKLYIMELDKTVIVKSKEKSTSGGYLYKTDFIEVIEDDETEKTLEKAKEDQREYVEKHNKKAEEDDQKEVIVDKKNKKKWYQFWK
ncbi:hypothetical protein ANABIO32_02280 [Rossellomorea marisflavi]|uniref:hypothetical protein n=1 Tax=Rossellomorea marisflavi TaxID=189381 RepID=UPI0025CAEB14|nr:hypothetical protein [Rossellomorea marisflavi]GLI82541.1 hypothetical protein ANABIO32_02280 [Rossellomorea marisflavi]